MNKTYIKFKAPKSNIDFKKDRLIKRLFINSLVWVFKIVIPKANPDFENKINEVKYWLVECNNETGAPEREIGLNEEEGTILKMPFKNNYGYWIDNNLLLNDFKEGFSVLEISKESFEQKWELLNGIEIK